MNKEREFKICLNRIRYFTYETARWNRALLEVQKGVSFQEALKEEVFIEERMKQNHSYHTLAVMIEHLLLLKKKYYTDDRPHGNWGNTVKACQVKAADMTEWDKKEGDPILTEYLSGALQGIYEAGVKRYIKICGHYPNRMDRAQSIPEHCPWTLEELVNDTVDGLLGYLQD